MTGRRMVALAATSVLLLAAPATASLPQVDYTLTGPLGDNGWYVGPVTVKWTLVGELSSTGCDTQTLFADTTGTQITCLASNLDGPVSATTKRIQIDQTPPSGVTASAQRQPDVRSWFTAPVGISWTGSDATSGIASCTSLTYSGPDTAAAAPAGSCRDRAGNVSAPVTFSLDYDATPPTLDGVSATAGPGRADIRWTAAADAVRATVVRDGAAGAPPVTVADVAAATDVAADTGLAPATTYTWTVTVLDAAGNATSQRVSATTPLSGTSPANGKATSSGKLKAMQLRWRRVRHASYYNVQVYRGAQKVLSAWPTHARLRLAAHWRYRGRTRRLIAGRTYRWFVWAGFGPRSAHRYGRLLAHGRFTVPKAH